MSIKIDFDGYSEKIHSDVKDGHIYVAKDASDIMCLIFITGDNFFEIFLGSMGVGNINTDHISSLDDEYRLIADVTDKVEITLHK